MLETSYLSITIAVETGTKQQRGGCMARRQDGVFQQGRLLLSHIVLRACDGKFTGRMALMLL